ncbi:MAG: transcriptional regulator [Actinobacteria bacterium HGW-Actinobacteria-6]|nr:MAG: transcriptional regulator [Actinobacteria bacterium HGW-Actinobacteria-6]
MMKVEAIIRPNRLGAVREAMLAAGATGVTVVTVTGHGAQAGVTQKWRGHEYTVSLLPKVLVMTVAEDDDAQEIAESVVAAARTGDMGDGKIAMSPVEDAVRIRTGESGRGAIG